MSDDGAHTGVRQTVAETAMHQVPDANAAPGHCGRQPRSGAQTHTVNGQLLLVNVVVILEYIVQIPHFDAPVKR